MGSFFGGLSSRRAAEAAASRIEELTNTLARQAVQEEFLKEATEQAAEAQRRKTEAVSEAARFMSDEVSSAFDSIIQNSESVTDAFKRMAFSMIEAMTQAVIFGNGPFAQLFNMGGSGGSGGGLLSSFLKGLFNAGPVSLYATGGRVAPKKEIGVGEEGPEYFVPDDKRQPVKLLGAKGPERFTPDGPGVVVPNEEVVSGRQPFRKIADRPLETPEGVLPPLIKKPEPVDVVAEAPDPVFVPVEQPPSVRVDVQQPDTVRPRNIPPEDVEANVIPPKPVTVAVETPDAVQPRVIQPEPVVVEAVTQAPRVSAPPAIARTLATPPAYPEPRQDRHPFIDAEQFFAMSKERPRADMETYTPSGPVGLARRDGGDTQQRAPQQQSQPLDGRRITAQARTVQAPSVRDRLQALNVAARGALVPADVTPAAPANGNGTGTVYSPVYHIDARGAQVGFAEEIRKQLDERDKENARRFADQVIDARNRRKFK